MDSIPVISQLKSFIQLLADDEEGALETQKNFSKRCPVVSQVRSVIQTINEDFDGALATQKEFLGEVNQMANSVPGVGHVKGVVHYAFDDKKGGDAAMKASSRTTGVALGGVAGFVAGGPAGAFVCGTAAGTAMDGIISVSDKAVNGEEADLYGVFKTIEDIDKGNHKAGATVDIIGTFIFDGLAGMTAGETVGRKRSVKLRVDKHKKKVIGEKGYAKLKRDAQQMDGNTLRSMSQEVSQIQLECQQIKDQPNLSNRSRNKQIRAASKQSTHTESNFHQLNRDSHLQGKIAADVQTKSGQRGSKRVIMEDSRRNYQLEVQKYLPDHDYRNAKVPPCRTPNIFDKYCDLPSGVHIATEVVALMTNNNHKEKNKNKKTKKQN